MIKSIINTVKKPIKAYIGNQMVWQYFTIPDLYKKGEKGVWLDPSDLKTMFQDMNGTVPVTKNGNPVALIKDKSGNGNHATQPTASARPIYRTDGKLHWLEFDGVDDSMVAAISMPQPYTRAVVARVTGEGDQRVYGSTLSQLWRIPDGRFLSFAGAVFSSSNKVDVGADFYAIELIKGRESLNKLNGIVSYGNAGSSGMTSLVLFSRGDALMGKGRLYSSVLVSKGLSNDDMLSLEQYLANRAGVTL